MISSPKYFGKKECSIIYCILIDMARNKCNPINYDPIAEIMGKPAGKKMGNHWAKETGHLLGEICDFENSNGRPMLSALVIRPDIGIPGKGFFELADEFGKLKSFSDYDKKAFWEQELQAVYALWK